MIELAKTLAPKEIPFIRTDFYEINGEVFFSEFTFYSDSGLSPFVPEHWDKALGDLMDLSTVR